MEASRINIKSVNFRGGNTIVRYTVTCECGCNEKPFLKYWPSKKKLTESQILTKISNEN